jgi:hydroxymethylpyrimidine/phosphomethylpyrimidine kinase
MTQGRPLVPLTIAGSDPTGGAGLQADLKVFLRFGLSGAAVVTSITAQSPTGVASVKPLPARLVKSQLEALLADVRPAAIKVGMLGSGENVRAVARALAPLARRNIPIVLDPVFAASDGTRLLPRKELPTFMRLLLPLATVVTPNLEEAAELAGMTEPAVRADAEAACQAILQAGARQVLITGGHMASEESTDVLSDKDTLTLFSLPRIPRRRRVHGTGCALTAAITAMLAQDIPIEHAVGRAKDYVAKAIAGSRPIGRGSRQLDFLALGGLQPDAEDASA